MSERDTPRKAGDVMGFPVAAGVLIAQGEMVFLNSTGFAAPFSAASGMGMVGIGRAESTVDNTQGTDGALHIACFQGIFKYDNDPAAPIQQSSLGTVCAALNGHTVSAQGSIKVGRVMGIEADGVWVRIYAGQA